MNVTTLQGRAIVWIKPYASNMVKLDPACRDGNISRVVFTFQNLPKQKQKNTALDGHLSFTHIHTTYLNTLEVGKAIGRGEILSGKKGSREKVKDCLL